MGTVLGAFLSRAGFSPDLISRDEAHIAALRTTGARIGGTVSFSTPPFDGKDGRGKALLPSEIDKNYDIIFLLTKQADNAATAATLGNHLSPGGIVCTMQNGIPEPTLEGVLGDERVMGCICVWGADKIAPGMSNLTSKRGKMAFNLDGKPRPMLHGVNELLEKICPVTLEPNFTGARWSKLLINAAFSGVSAITGYSFGHVAADRRSRDCALHIARECVAVCRAAGIHIEPLMGKYPADFLFFDNPVKKALLSAVMRVAMSGHRAIKSGMLKDIDRGRASDIDFINGAVSRAGRECGVPSPCNDRIVEIVHAIERSERKYGPWNLDLVG